MHDTGRWAPFDMYTARGTTIEVKVGEPYFRNRRLGWGFTIHRHGKLCGEQCVNFYIFRLEPGPKLRNLGIEQAMHLVLPATEVTAKLAWISLRSLLLEYAGRVNKTEAITACDATRTLRDLAVAKVRSKRFSPRMAHRKLLQGLLEDEITQIAGEERRMLANDASVKALLAKINSMPPSPAEIEIAQQDALERKGKAL